MKQKVRTAVFPVGGLGTRFLPATKAMPKEMLPVVDKPLIQYALEEAQAAGIDHFVFVTGRGKAVIEDHFDHSYELEDTLRRRGKDSALQQVDAFVPPPGRVAYTRQMQPLGLGHAVACAAHLVGREPFAVLLADDLILSQTPCLKQMVEAYEEVGGNIVAAMEVAQEETSRYGIITAEGGRAAAAPGELVGGKALVEKPAPEEAPSRLAVIGRYILQPEVFDQLSQTRAGAGGEAAGGTVNRAFLRYALPLMFIPKLIGVAGVITLPADIVSGFIFALVSIYAVSYILDRPFQVRGGRLDPWLLMLGGYVSGTSLIAAPLVVPVAASRMPKEQVRDTLFVLWFLLVAVKLIAFVIGGVDLQWQHHLWLLPCAAAGHLLGLRFHAYTLRAETKVFFRVLGVGLLAVSLAGLLRLAVA